MRITTQQIMYDLDRAYQLWTKEDREDWEWLESIGLFKKHGCWNEKFHEPDLHKMKKVLP